jgi:hypothetical protein
MTATNGAAVLEKVRAARADALAAGQRPPGRPALAKLTGATDHQIRRALADLETEAAAPQASVGHQPDPTPVDEPVAAPVIPVAPTGVRQPRPWPLAVIAVAAAVAVWGGWVELGNLTGFGLVQPLPGLWDGLRINTAIVLPLGIEAYGGYALRTWLSSADLSDKTRAFARRSAIASLVVGAGAQVASHLMRAANVTSAPPLVTILVACVPVLVLGLATGLATLVKRDASAGGQ